MTNPAPLPGDEDLEDVMEPVKERPILFSGEMVRAILDGRKTQTRRAVKFPIHDRGFGCEIAGSELNGELVQDPGLCPYGKPGDRLWVRETFRLFNAVDECGCSEAPCPCPESGAPIYRATHDGGDSKWTPSIFMPRKYCRILLEITDVWVERLNDISSMDAIAEGCSDAHGTPKLSFGGLWESINGKGSFDDRWVWVVEFKRI